MKKPKSKEKKTFKKTSKNKSINQWKINQKTNKLMIKAI